ncbi:MAG TPA: lysophospholipid acyltransferase family protein [Candidatus Limnocylindria bacterium]|nr:lysophospholipid acyltransferase family protein [Candidatus Limnocylindria bacterium]
MDAALNPRRDPPRQPGVADSKRYRVMRTLDRFLVHALLRVRVIGPERWPDAPYCLVPNHHSAWDPLLLLAICPAVPRITFFGPRERDFSRGLSNRVMGFFGGVIPIHPDKTSLLSAVRAVRRVFEAKGVLAIFPEGRNGFAETQLQPFEEGAVAFAASAGVPILPVAFSGTTFVWIGKRVTVHFGAPIDTRSATDEAGRDRLTAEVRAAIQAMLPTTEPPPDEDGPLRGFMTDVFHSKEETARRVAALGR